MELERFKSLHQKYNKEELHQSDTITQEYDEYMMALHNDKACLDWYLTSILIERKFDYTKHCCLQMSFQISTPNLMPDEEDDHDIIMKYHDVYDEYGIPIYDGGSSVIQINYCPWCGSKLPESKRDRWFEELRRLGFKDDYDDVPEEYTTDEWWRT